MVNCTALASSNTCWCSRARISRQTPARAAGPASRHAGIAVVAAASSAATSACGYRTSNGTPKGLRSVATRPVVPGWSSGKSLPRYARNAAAPSGAALSPYTFGLGDSANADQ